MIQWFISGAGSKPQPQPPGGTRSTAHTALRPCTCARPCLVLVPHPRTLLALARPCTSTCSQSATTNAGPSLGPHACSAGMSPLPTLIGQRARVLQTRLAVPSYPTDIGFVRKDGILIECNASDSDSQRRYTCRRPALPPQQRTTVAVMDGGNYGPDFLYLAKAGTLGTVLSFPFYAYDGLYFTPLRTQSNVCIRGVSAVATSACAVQ